MRFKVDGERVEAFRRAKGLLKRELAARAGIHPNQIGSILRGEAVGLQVARRVARAVGSKLSDIATVADVADVVGTRLSDGDADQGAGGLPCAVAG